MGLGVLGFLSWMAGEDWLLLAAVLIVNAFLTQSAVYGGTRKALRKHAREQGRAR